MKTIQVLLIGTLLAASAPADAEHPFKREHGDATSRFHPEVRAPSFGAPPRGFIYGGPYPPPYPYWPPGTYAWPGAGGGYGSAVPSDDAGEPSHLPGRLIILTQPVSAAVLVDGVRLERRGDLSYLALLAEGEYRIEARAQGYRDGTRDVYVHAGTGMFVTLRLAPE